MVIRRTTTLDHTLTHLWIDDHHTECGITGDQLPNNSGTTCGACLDRYGRALAEAFSHLTWLGLPGAPTVHAFNPEDLDKHTHVWPVCHMYSISVSRLEPRTYRMRCPNCVNHLRRRSDNAC